MIAERAGVKQVLGLTLLAVWAAHAQPPGPIHVTVRTAEQRQVVQGFGLNFTAPYFRDEQRAMFELAIDDLGVTLWRVVPYFVYSNWEEVNDNDDPKVMNWDYYNERYSSPVFEAAWKALRFLNSKGVRPMIALMGAEPDWMVAKEWTAPKHQPGTESRVPSLDPAKYDEFAEMVVSMAIYARRKARIDFELFSPFNETDCYPREGPRIDPADAPAVLAAVARRLKAEGMGDVRLVAPDNCNLETDYASPILGNAEVMPRIAAIAVHSYGDGSLAPVVERAKKSNYPSTPVWLTEYGDLNDEDHSEESEWAHFSMAANRRALNALNDGAAAVFYFNLFDDYEECMRRQTYYGLFRRADQIYQPRKRYFATRQLFHFVRPGARVLATGSDSDKLTVGAFRNSAVRSLVVVGVKEGGPDEVQVSVPGSGSMLFDLYATTREANCVFMGTLRMSGGAVRLTLPGQAIFTLRGAPAGQ